MVFRDTQPDPQRAYVHIVNRKEPRELTHPCFS
jgi:hypothetical protein